MKTEPIITVTIPMSFEFDKELSERIANPQDLDDALLAVRLDEFCINLSNDLKLR